MTHTDKLAGIFPSISSKSRRTFYAGCLTSWRTISAIYPSQQLLTTIHRELKQLGALANTLYTGSSVWRSFYTAGDAQVLEDMRIKTIVVTEHFKVCIFSSTCTRRPDYDNKILVALSSDCVQDRRRSRRESDEWERPND